MATLSTIEYTANPEQPAFNMGDEVKKVYGSYAKTAALPADNDLLIIARGIPVSAVIQKINVTHPAIVDFTYADIVLLDENGSVVQDSGYADEYLAEAVTFVNARNNQNILSALRKPLKTLLNLGGDKLAPSFDIALRVVTGGANTGTIDFDIEYTNS